MTGPIELTCDNARCLVLPQCGGSLGGWWVAGEPLLRAASAPALASGDPTRLAGFPLVPYSNRIGNARFYWRGETVQLRRNRSDEAHALHGVGWQRSWAVIARTQTSVTLRLDHPGDADWPWPFVAEQTIVLAPARLTLALSARNTADGAAPLSVGYHPYFERGGAKLTLDADRVWTNGADALPLAAAPPAGSRNLANGPPIAGREIDNCYEGVRWPAKVEWPARGLTLIVTPSPDLPHAVVYSNAEANALCVEPVAHISNALNLAGEAGFPICRAGEAVSSTLDLLLQAQDSSAVAP